MPSPHNDLKAKSKSIQHAWAMLKVCSGKSGSCSRPVSATKPAKENGLIELLGNIFVGSSTD